MSKSKFDIKFDYKEPNQEQISKGKDFNRLLNKFERHEKKNSVHSIIYKFNTQIPVILITILLILLMFFLYKVDNKQKQKAVKKIEQTN